MGETLEMQAKSDIRRWPFEIENSNFRKFRKFRLQKSQCPQREVLSEKPRATSVYKVDIITEKASAKIRMDYRVIRERLNRNEDIHILLPTIMLDFFRGG
jgi:hypothetical protein